MDLDYSKICRVCMKEVSTLVSLFRVNLYKKMMACTSLQVWPNDNLPGKICNRCVATLHMCYQFKKQCEQSDVKLRQHLKSDFKNIDILDPLSFVNKEANRAKKESTQPISKPDHEMENDALKRSICRKNEHPLLMEATSTTKAFQNDNSMFINVYRNCYTIPQEFQATALDSHFMVPNENTDTHQIEAVTIESIDTNSKYLMLNQQREEENESKCHTCNKIFKTPMRLKRHMKIHDGLLLAYKCTICSKGFSHHGNYKMHMRIHNNERPFKCLVCDKGCRQAQDLEKHVRTHTGEKPHKCNLCPKAFATGSNLIAHIRTHTGEKPYVCSICQKAFCQSNELTKHTRSHTGEKSHVCDICNRGGLIAHRRCHTKERPYFCPICNRSFVRRVSLTIHVRKHKKKPLKCNKCDITFTLWSELKEHLSSLHDIHVKNMSEIDKIQHKFNCMVCEESFDKVDNYNEHLKTHLVEHES